jgi:hypothetical protein
MVKYVYTNVCTNIYIYIYIYVLHMHTPNTVGCSWKGSHILYSYFVGQHKETIFKQTCDLEGFCFRVQESLTRREK